MSQRIISYELAENISRPFGPSSARSTSYFSYSRTYFSVFRIALSSSITNILDIYFCLLLLSFVFHLFSPRITRRSRICPVPFFTHCISAISTSLSRKSFCRTSGFLFDKPLLPSIQILQMLQALLSWKQLSASKVHQMECAPS